MKIYRWDTGSSFGTIKARNMKEAMVKATEAVVSDSPYLSDKAEKFEIRVELQEDE